jgi:hypothetical protein
MVMTRMATPALHKPQTSVWKPWIHKRPGGGGGGEGGLGIMEGWVVFKLAGLMSVNDGLDNCQWMMGFMKLGTAAGRNEI